MHKILIVDDDPDVLDTIKLVLEIGGYDVLALLNTNKLYDKIQSYKPDLIVLDIVIGNIDGRSICKELKQNPVTKSLPILMMSGLFDAKEVLAGENGPDDFLTKPFEMSAFIDKIVKLIAHKKSIDYTIN